MSGARPKRPAHVGSHRRAGLDWDRSTDLWLLYELMNAIADGEPIDGEAAPALAERIGRVLDGEPIERAFRLAKRGPKRDPLAWAHDNAVALAVKVRIDGGAQPKRALSEVAELTGMGQQGVRHIYRDAKPALALMNVAALLELLQLRGHRDVDAYLRAVASLNARLADTQRTAGSELASIPVVVAGTERRRNRAKLRREKLTTPR